MQKLELQLTQQAHMLDDPLALHEQLIAAYTASRSTERQLLEALERCTKALVDDKRYSNDLRYLRIWMQYAKLCKEPQGIFEFLYQRRLFRDLASFYEEWARLAVSSGDVQLGRQILSKGIHNGAQPLERLKQTLAGHADCAQGNSLKRTSWENGTSVPFFFHANPLSHAASTSDCSIVKKNSLPEVPYYDPAIIDNGRVSFEQARAKFYRSTASPQRHQTRTNVSALTMDEEDDDNDQVPGLSQTINPDELTHISIFKDSTMTAGDLSRLINDEASMTAAANDLVCKHDCLIRCDQAILAKLRPSTDATMPAIKTPIGHFYVESKLNDWEYLAVDVSTDNDVPQKVVLHVDSRSSPLGAYEAAFIYQYMRQVGAKVCCFPDAVLYVRPHYSGGTLADLLKKRKLHPMVGLYFLRDFVQQTSSLQLQGVYHGGIFLERSFINFALPRCSLVLLGPCPWDSPERGRQTDLNALESLTGCLLKNGGGDDVLWRPFVQALQRKAPLKDLLQVLEDTLQSYRGTPTLKSLLNRLELELI